MSYSKNFNKAKKNTENMDLEYLFKNDIKDPFFYNLELNKSDNYQILFENVKNIFITGLIIHYGNEEEKKIDMVSLSPEKIKVISDYMLSIGLKVNYKLVDAEERDLLYRRFLYDIEHLEDITITVQSNWKTGFIQSINVNIDKEATKENTLKEIAVITSKHTYANHFLKINPPIVLKDYAIFVNIGGKDITHVISFDFANIGDYPKPIVNVEGPWQG